MTGTIRTSADLDPRRRRILFRAWHRGIREMDLVMGSFADAEIARLDERELDEFERLMARADADLIKWVTGEREVPTDVDTPLFRRMAAYQADFDPVEEPETSR
jgi:antitoxin CptB